MSVEYDKIKMKDLFVWLVVVHEAYSNLFCLVSAIASWRKTACRDLVAEILYNRSDQMNAEYMEERIT